MARRSFVTTTALLVAVGLAGCGGPATERDAGPQTAVEVAAAMGAEGQALAALGLDPTELDPAPAEPEAVEGKTRQERIERWRDRREARVLLRRDALHGEAVVRTKDGGTRTVSVQRGEVTALDGTGMTVKSTDGFTQSWTFADDLRVVERRKTIHVSDLKVGTEVGVAGAKNADSTAARLIVVPVPE
jgi:hypothetical protein